MILATLGAVCITAFLFLWQFLAPSGGGNDGTAFVILSVVGLAMVLSAPALFFAFVAARAEKWLAKLPRAALVFTIAPEAYRR